MAQGTQFGNKLNIWAWLSNLMYNDIGILTNSGTPTNGTSGTGAGKAGPSCLLLDITNKVLYINTNTKASPTWNAVSITTPSEISIAVINKTGSDIGVDKLVALSGLDATSGLPKIVLADADVAALDDVYVTTAAIADSASGIVYKGATSAANLNTNSASAAGDPVYLSTTAGAFTVTAPTTAVSRVTPVGFVLVKSASVGQILWNIGPTRIIGSNELQASLVLVTPTIGVANGTSLALTGAATSSGGGIGYATGAGGTVTQLTDKSTGVTLSKLSGAITMNNAALAADAIVSFVLTNTFIAATDVLVLNHISGGTPGKYHLNARAGAGSATIDVTNISAGSLSEAVVIQFVVIKGVNA